MRVFQSSPGAIFPFGVEGCTTFVTGAECKLINALQIPDPALADMMKSSGYVSVATTPTSTTFTVSREGYFDPVGSEIRFSTYTFRGNLYLRQSTNVTGRVSNVVRIGVRSGMAKSTWKQQAANFRKLLRK